MTAYVVLLKDMAARLGWPLLALIGLMLLVGLTEGLGTALLFSLLIRLGVSGGVDASSMTAGIENALTWLHPDPGPWFVFAVLAVVAALQAGLFIQQSWLMATLSRRYAASWQIDLFSAFIRADWMFLTERKSGDLVNAIVIETGRATASCQGIAQLAAAIVVATIYLIVAFFVSWQITLLLIGLTIAMLISISGLYRTSYRIGRQTGPFNAAMLSTASEQLGAAKIIKSAGVENDSIARVSQAVGKLQGVARVSMFLPNLVRGVFEMMGVVGLAALLVIGTLVLDVAAANLLVVLALFVRLLPRFTSLQTQLHNLNTFVPAVATLSGLLGEARKRQEGTSGLQLADEPAATFTVDKLSVGYGTRNVIESLDLSLKLPGLYGVVGGSGAGKSSLMHALVGLVPPQTGTVRLGSVALNDAALSSWRRHVTLVPQETFLFNASVRDNLALAMPGASHDEIVAAARAAHAHDFISALPSGYDTTIGDQGVLLSGGQRQRLGIARALLMKPAILLMDEPTSSLDPDSEGEILKTLDDLRRRIGIVVVAHRLATVRQADRIFVLENGAIIESGTWDELLAHRKRFHDLARAQHMVLAETGT